MPEQDDHSLYKLFQAAGHHEPAQDLTERIMGKVAISAIAAPVIVAPLIAKRGWMAIGAGLLAIPMFLHLGLDGDPSADGIPWVGQLIAYLDLVKLPAGNWPKWFTLGAGCVLLFTCMDMQLARSTTAHH